MELIVEKLKLLVRVLLKTFNHAPYTLNHLPWIEDPKPRTPGVIDPENFKP
jgi:hypothetical protein